ncbi:SWIM zinc finger family protein [Massilia violaceinigra]|uniref:SWIM zinc finger family protein n=1 Tax=Massilia violaceinigra TaxID=2045208 RepID=A0ABY4A6G7_9BURK|nr:SWIM zinc finger family protein [Massilia violaceinigra]UOD30379.1 SWIM zinc finger family protein [Massilia violaceinigra]
MAAHQHAYHYLAPSSLDAGAQPRLQLATSDPQGAHPHFFEGRLVAPRLSAELLSAVHVIVGSRFFTPSNTLARALALADPVVTAGGGRLRFEGFSSCCSAYIRVDMLPGAYDGEVVGKGTTNVDFNAPMRAALACVRDADGLFLSIGQDALRLRSGSADIVEKKVALPLRWLRGMLEVQSYQASMHKKLEARGIDALRFFRSLPKASTSRTPLWVVGGPGGLRTTTRADSLGVRVADTSRLRVLEPLLPKALSLTVYADDAQQASAWVLDFGSMRLTLALSAETWRGFSGEGQALRALMRSGDNAALAQVRAQLQWQPQLDSAVLARELALERPQVDDALRVLGVSGLAGYDVAEGSYFHRVLPFDLTLAEDMHPRLAGARALVDAGAVRLLRQAPLAATVQGSTVLHRVREVGGELVCTCPWFGKHQGQRGPCKHVLAAEAVHSMQA